jgi:hypothetical protein
MSVDDAGCIGVWEFHKNKLSKVLVDLNSFSPDDVNGKLLNLHNENNYYYSIITTIITIILSIRRVMVMV